MAPKLACVTCETLAILLFKEKQEKERVVEELQMLKERI